MSETFNTLEQLGGDFQREARREQGVGLIKPLVKSLNNPFNQKTIPLVESGVQDWDEFNLGNNYGTSDRYVEKAYDYIARFEQGHSGGGLERDFNDSDALNNDILDPTKMAQLKKEPQRGPHEIFDEYGRKTTDYVGLVQKGIASYDAEHNLYKTAGELHAEAVADKKLREGMPDLRSDI